MNKNTLILLTLLNIFIYQTNVVGQSLQAENSSSSCCGEHNNKLSNIENKNLSESDNDKFSNPSVQFLNAWARPAAIGKNSAVYLTISNQSLKNIEIIGVSAPDIANIAMFHQSITDDNGVVSMSHIEHLLIPLQTEFILKPGGFHIMLMKVTKQLRDGDSFNIIFTMKDQTTTTIKVQVKK
ncbi:hypothetical protein OCHUTO_0752 [Orientia chuto str. Dubai]|uniref:Copper chaperone PCu(A)C n=1 Tax=Orientia chuto str. Dubai TaxID=1359168 RepID=A0A0F3MIT3_9RICK|nr:copper chaperone PCu(A)C [Candidatus Orientia mediorientalis]KJV55645.1 hypothetical protein OCHUTO_0752 [Orientia chuto str. Dubai]